VGNTNLFKISGKLLTPVKGSKKIEIKISTHLAKLIRMSHKKMVGLTRIESSYLAIITDYCRLESKN
jgi:hypothetical protein